MRRLIPLIGGAALMTFAPSAPAAVPLAVAKRVAHNYTRGIREQGWTTHLRGCPVVKVGSGGRRECSFDIPAELTGIGAPRRVDLILVLAIYRDAGETMVSVVAH